MSQLLTEASATSGGDPYSIPSRDYGTAPDIVGVMVFWEHDASDLPTISSVTIGGVTLTELGTVTAATTGLAFQEFAAMYYTTSPATGSQTGSVDFSGSVNDVAVVPFVLDGGEDTVVDSAFEASNNDGNHTITKTPGDSANVSVWGGVLNRASTGFGTPMSPTASSSVDGTLASGNSGFTYAGRLGTGYTGSTDYTLTFGASQLVSMVWAEFSASGAGGTEVDANTAELTLTTYPATIDKPTTVLANTAALTLTTYPATVAAGSVTYESIIDPDNAVGTDYTSLQAWMTAINGLYNSGDTVRAVCRRTGSTDDSQVQIRNLTSGVIVEIVSDPAYPMYRVVSTSTGTSAMVAFSTSGASVLVEDLYLSQPNTGTDSAAGYSGLSGSVSTLNRCIIEDCHSTGVRAGGSTITLNNCIGINCATGDVNFSTFYCLSSGTLTCNYCVAVNSQGHGFNHDTGTFTANNCYGGGNATNDYDGGITQTTCGSSDTTGSAGLQSIAWSTANFVNVTAGSEDVQLVSGSALIEEATVIGITTDFAGVTRDGTSPDIGAYEFVPAASGSAPIFMHHRRIMNG